jgi:hypothetical protein
VLTRVVPPPECRDYLRCSFCMDTLIKARALKTAIDLGFLSYIIPRESVSLEALARSVRCDLKGTQLVVNLLVASGVLVYRNEDIVVSAEFIAALPYFDLICTKIALSGYLLSDFSENFTALVARPEEFRENATLFSLFEYTPESNVDVQTYLRTRLWVQLTSVLSKYEAAPFLWLYPLDGSADILDIGGNSGSFASQLCQSHPDQCVSVFDLPLVCSLGLNCMLSSPCVDRISFVAGDLRSDLLPHGFGLHIFKSFLHDWSDLDVSQHLSRSADALPSGGKLVIFERISWQNDYGGIPVWRFCDLPVLLFERTYRNPSFYLEALSQAGLVITKAHVMRLDNEFCLIEATKR